MIYNILAISLILGVPVYWLVDFIVKKNNDNKQYKIIKDQRNQENQLKLLELIKSTNDNLDRHIKQINTNQDKYQIGRAIGRLCFEFQTEYSKLTGSRYIQEGQTDIDSIAKRIDEIANSDIQIENGMEDFRSEQKRLMSQSVVQKVEKKYSEESKHDNNLDKTITKSFTGSEKFLPIIVNNYIKANKDYVLVFQTPIMKTLFGMYTTTITMKKIK